MDVPRAGRVRVRYRYGFHLLVQYRYPSMCRPLHRALLLPLFFTLAGCGDSPTMSELPDDAVILAFGDSLTEGVGARNDES